MNWRHLSNKGPIFCQFTKPYAWARQTTGSIYRARKVVQAARPPLFPSPRWGEGRVRGS